MAAFVYSLRMPGRGAGTLVSTTPSATTTILDYNKASNLDESWDTIPFPVNRQAMRWGLKILVFTSRALLIPQRKRFRNRFRGLMTTRVLESPVRLIFIKQRSGGSEALVFGIHQQRFTDSRRTDSGPPF
ncbi:hypothetical protein E2C01_023664 [Portunus trituberculatus]|uniref:Uncharacterized protein n=1 Tax=Portunus trituberculatus TaxID=210409 RepID=A0A5B7E8I9_PORTR|nr:hypothetical protein [Portunus trituberculatus]